MRNEKLACLTIAALILFAIFSRQDLISAQEATLNNPVEEDVVGEISETTPGNLTMAFKDADLIAVLELLAYKGGVNIVTDKDVSGIVTVRLVDVPWDQALDVILQSRSLGKSRVGNVLRIAPLDTLKKEDQAELQAK